MPVSYGFSLILPLVCYPYLYFLMKLIGTCALVRTSTYESVTESADIILSYCHIIISSYHHKSTFISNTSPILTSFYFFILCYKDNQYGYIRFKCISLRLNIHQRHMSRWKVSALESWIQVPFYDDIKMFSMRWVQKNFLIIFIFEEFFFFFNNFIFDDSCSVIKNNNFFLLLNIWIKLTIASAISYIDY